MNKFNTQRLQEYAAVFGNAKIRRLWDEFLTVSARNWDNFEQKTPDEQKNCFHNWKSGSLVFGLEEFSALCAEAEENILARRLHKLPRQIQKIRDSFWESTDKVTEYLNSGKIEQ